MRYYVGNQFGKRRRRDIGISAVILDTSQPDHYKCKRRHEEGSFDDELSTARGVDAANALVPDDSSRSPKEWISSSHHGLGGGERNSTGCLPACCDVASGYRSSRWQGKTTFYGCRQPWKAVKPPPGVLQKGVAATAILCHGADNARHACNIWKPRNIHTNSGRGKTNRQRPSYGSLSKSEMKIK